MAKRKMNNNAFSDFLLALTLLKKRKSDIVLEVAQHKAEISRLEASLSEIENRISASETIVDLAKKSGLLGSFVEQSNLFFAPTPADKSPERVNRIRKWEASLTPEQRAVVKAQREAALIKARAKKAENEKNRKAEAEAKKQAATENRRASLVKAREVLSQKRKAEQTALDAETQAALTEVYRILGK